MPGCYNRVMQDERYRLVFRGEVLPDQHPAVVKKRLKELLKIDDARAAGLFSGEPVVLRKDADTKTAAKFQVAFKKSGARLRVLPVESSVEEPSGETPEPVAVTLAGSEPAKPPEKKLSLAERLALESGPVDEPPESPAPDRAAEASGAEADSRSVDEPSEPELPAAAADTDHPVANDRESPIDDDEAAYTLRPPGADVLDPEERLVVPVAEVTTDHLSVSDPQVPPAPELQQPTNEPTNEPPDVSHLTLAEVGALLVEPGPPTADVQLDVDFEVMAPGSPLGVAGQAVDAALDFTDVDFELAEVGAIIGRNPMDLPAPPPPPDTSHLSLQD